PLGRRIGTGSWAIAFGVAGTSLGMTVGVFLRVTYEQWLFLVVGSGMVGGFLGAVYGQTVTAAPGLQGLAELLAILALAAGTGAIFGWKIIWPHIDALTPYPPPEDEWERMSRITILSTAALAALAGFVAWAVAAAKRRS